MASPTALPSMSLAGKIHRAGLADHHHLDLAGVLQLALDLAGDLLGQLARLAVVDRVRGHHHAQDRKSTRLNSSHQIISYAVFCLKKKTEMLLIAANRCLAYLSAFAPQDRELPTHGLA